MDPLVEMRIPLRPEKDSIKDRLISLVELSKIRISLPVALTAGAGCLLASPHPGTRLFLSAAGVFLLACGSCGLNQYQERGIDGLMGRTKDRPLPSGKLTPEAGLRASSAVILAGLLVLFHAGSGALALGLFAVVWYNIVYTPLKRKTPFSVVPGALIGAVPPLLGWVSGGGDILDPRIWGVAFFFYLWQVPHFWLLLLEFSDEYERAGLPSLLTSFSPRTTRCVVFVWLSSTGVSSLLIPLFGFFHSSFSLLLLIAVALWFFWTAALFLRSPEAGSFKGAFLRLNIYALIVISLLLLDRWMSL